MSPGVVDALEVIDIEHHADELAAVPACPGKLLLHARLQVSAVVPAGQHIGESAAPQPRPVHRIFDAEGRDHAEACKKVARVLRGKAIHVGAAEIDAADQLVAAAERYHRDAGDASRRRDDHAVVAGGKRAQPGPPQRNVLRRQPRQCVDEYQFRIAVNVRREQQVTDIVSRVSEHDADGPEVEAVPQTFGHFVQKLVEIGRLQQPQLATLRAAKLLIVLPDLLRQGLELSFSCLEFRLEFFCALHATGTVQDDRRFFYQNRPPASHDGATERTRPQPRRARYSRPRCIRSTKPCSSPLATSSRIRPAASTSASSGPRPKRLRCWISK